MRHLRRRRRHDRVQPRPPEVPVQHPPAEHGHRMHPRGRQHAHVGSLSADTAVVIVTVNFT